MTVTDFRTDIHIILRVAKIQERTSYPRLVTVIGCLYFFLLYLGFAYCDDGWELFADSCYLPSTSKASLADAFVFCQQKDSDVVSIADANEQAFVESIW